MSSGKRQHFMPAALIGQFTFENIHSSTPFRNKKIYVRLRKQTDPFERTPSEILKMKNFYTLTSESTGLKKNAIDAIWDSIEPYIPTMINRLSRSYAKDQLPMDVFLYFVEFCTQLIVRNPKFNENYNERINTIFDYESLEKEELISVKDNTNISRVMEMQRLRPLLMYADLAIFKSSAHNVFINNDNGYIIGMDEGLLERVTLTFPLTPDLVLTFYINRNPAAYNISLLRTPKKFKHQRLFSDSVDSFNKSIYFHSNNLIFSSKKTLLLDDFPKNHDYPGTYGFWYYYDQQELKKISVKHELDYNKIGGKTLFFRNISDPL
ncbi:DUF4238 domain-containing protein [Leuconostoc sp. MS02]|uniref:DUF4238 domain-containing protein n=1 Tax=Leuconostoc aquikimchii TaxID=3236804 RepID=A0ABV3S225_9LACO